MSRFFRTSGTPIVDYGYQYPIEVIAGALQARQGAYDVNKADWEKQIQAIEDTPYLKLGLGDEEAYAELKSKYEKMINEVPVDADYSRINSQLNSLKREINSDFGINGVGSALRNRYNEFGQFQSEFKDNVLKNNYKPEDYERFASNFNKFKDDSGEISSLGVPTIGYRPEYDSKITNYIDKILKDETDVNIVKDPSGRYFIKTKEGGIREQRLNNALNAYIESIPGHKDWRQWDTRKTIQELENEDGSINTSAQSFIDAQDYVASTILNNTAQIEKIDAVLKGKLNSKDRSYYEMQKKALEDENSQMKGLTDEQYRNIAINRAYQDYDNEVISPYMSRANWSITDMSMDTNQFALEAYKSSLRMKEKEEEDKKALANMITLPGQVVPLTNKSKEEAYETLKTNNRQARTDFTTSNLAIFEQLAAVDKNLESMLSDYRNAKGADKIALERTINEKVKNWYDDYNKGKDTGSYAPILQKNKVEFDTYKTALGNSESAISKAENASKIQTELIMTNDLKNSINELKTWFKTKNAVLPPEIQKAVNSNDLSDFVMLIERGKITPDAVRKFSKLDIGHDKADAENFSRMLNNIDSAYKNALKPREDGESYQSQNSLDVYFPDDIKETVTSVNEQMTYAIETGYAGLKSMNQNTVAANEKNAVGNGEIKSRKAILSTTVIDGVPYMTVVTTYQDENKKTKQFIDKAEIPVEDLPKYKDAYNEMAKQDGATGVAGRIVLARLKVGNTFEAGDFLYNSKNGMPTYMGQNDEFKILPDYDTAGNMFLRLYYSPDLTLEKENREYQPVDNPYNSNKKDNSYADINTVFDVIGAAQVK